jgi:hypothetical protein
MVEQSQGQCYAMTKCVRTLVLGALRCLTAQLTGLNVAARSAEKVAGIGFTTVG